jgi:hypothetical protein
MEKTEKRESGGKPGDGGSCEGFNVSQKTSDNLHCSFTHIRKIG